MGYGTSRPPVTEGMADAIVRDIKSHEGKTGTSEVPLAFQTSHRSVDPETMGAVRQRMALFGLFALIVLAVLIVIWSMA